MRKHKVGILKKLSSSPEDHGLQGAPFGLRATLVLKKRPVPNLSLMQLFQGEIKSVAPESSQQLFSQFSLLTSMFADSSERSAW